MRKSSKKRNNNFNRGFNSTELVNNFVILLNSLIVAEFVTKKFFG